MGIAQNKLLKVVQEISLEKLETGMSQEEAEKVWNEADSNKDGILSEAEAKELLRGLNLSVMNRIKKAVQELEEHLQSDELLRDWMKGCDENGDGKITREEFLKVLTTGHAIDSIPKVLLEGIHNFENQQAEKKRKLDMITRDNQQDGDEEEECDEDEEEQQESTNGEPSKKKVKSDVALDDQVPFNM